MRRKLPESPLPQLESESEPLQQYDVEQEPIVLSKSLLDLFLEDEHPSDLIALYTFYYYTSKWQKTNSPRATTNFAAVGLKWSEARIRRTKSKLKSMGLIKDVMRRTTNNKFAAGWYVHVSFVWGRDAVNKIRQKDGNCNKNNGGTYPDDFLQGRQPDTVENEHPNSLSALSINSLSANNSNSLKTKTAPDPATPLELIFEGLPEAWQKEHSLHKIIKAFIQHRAELTKLKKAKPLTEIACHRFANDWSKHPLDVILKSIDTSIRRGWTDVFPESVNSNGNGNGHHPLPTSNRSQVPKVANPIYPAGKSNTELNPNFYS